MKRLIVDSKYCIGCFACEVACKQEHRLPVGPRLIRVITSTDKEIHDVGPVQFKPSMCRHCGKAPCVTACPTKALSYGEMGIVTVNREDCIGCRMCAEECPFNVPQFHPEDMTVLLCDLCIERLNEGKDPACVHHCPARVLRVADVND